MGATTPSRRRKRARRSIARCWPTWLRFRVPRCRRRNSSTTTCSSASTVRASPRSPSNRTSTAITQRDGVQSLERGHRVRPAADARSDYENWIARLNAIGPVIDQTIAAAARGDARKAHAAARDHGARPQPVRAAARRSKPEDSPFYAPFQQFPRDPGAGGAAAPRRRRARGDREERACPPTAASTSSSEGVPAGLPRSGRHLGHAAAAPSVTRTASSATPPPSSRPDEIHELGLKEVARIRGEMDEVIAAGRIPGHASPSSSHSCAPIRSSTTTTPRSCCRPTRRSWRSASIRCSSKLFGKLPRTPYGVRPIPTTSAPEHDHRLLPAAGARRHARRATTT